MYKLDLPVDLKEAAVLQRRRDAELQRQSRVFDARVRTVGVDKDALRHQIQDKKTRKETDNKRQEAFDAQMVQNDKITCLLDDRQKEDIQNLNKAINEFRLCLQQKENRREFDLYDPQALKKDLPARVSDDDPRCTVSGVQKLLGEDLTEHTRRKAQQEQLREWSLQQQREQQKALEDKRLADGLYDKHRIELDKKAMELQRMEEKARRDVCTFTKEFNKAQRLKEEERQRQAEWDRRRVQEARAMVLLERQQKRQEKELRKEQDHINLQLVQAHEAQKNYFNKEVFTNPPTDAYFDQFNTTSR
ncbi:RIB43A-like with coiled-coils protein 2 isoform X2 [Lithobates pipiens]